jgi:hypothetical protein
VGRGFFEEAEGEPVAQGQGPEDAASGEAAEPAMTQVPATGAAMDQVGEPVKDDLLQVTG